ncbi:MAG: adaptor protein MecA [Roseburia sp.]
MKIEKVNDNQIRCTLTREDLAERQIKLSELAYGTEKAKLLFRDMMQQAAYEFGFEADDIPLMIEAIPLSADTIILVITKVEYPEELDTRFSRFSEPDPEDLYEDAVNAGPALSEGADDILGLFRKIQEERRRAEEQQEEQAAAADTDRQQKEDPVQVLVDITKLFVFNDLSEVTRLAHVLDGFYTGNNDLYKNETNHKYYLLVSKSSQSPEAFNKVCNILSEYAAQQTFTPAAKAFFGEHYHAILTGNALQTLAEL